MRRPSGYGWAAAALASGVAFVVPLQTYLGNADIYPFSAVRLVPELLLIAALVFCALLLLGKILSLLGFGIRFQSLCTALLLCIYLESGILSLGIPELNGGFVPMLSDSGRGVIDVCVWSVIIVSFVVCSRWLKPFAHWISPVLLVLMVASLADIRGKTNGHSQPPPQSSSCISSGFESQPTVVANVRYSPGRNVLVFILDSMPGRDVADLMRTNAALRAKFSGFTAFPNNIGMHECTKRGVPGLVTGRYYDPAEMPESEYPLTMYGSNSFVTAAVRAGWNVAFSPDLLPYGFTNLPVERRIAREEKRRTRDALALLRQSKEVPYLSLFDLTAFRIAPFLFKGPILYSRIRHAVKGCHSSEGFWDERIQYSQLVSRPVGSDPHPFLGVFHTRGVHPPWDAALPIVVADKLMLLGNLMESYRKSGLYDRSLIIVTSDHGLDYATPVGNYPATASTLLWVKPVGACGDYGESPLPTSHARIATLVREALDGRESDFRAVLKCDRRLFRRPDRTVGGGSFRDWCEP